MKIPARLYELLCDESGRLLDRACEAVILDLNDAVANGPSREPSPDVIQATSDLQEEYDRLFELLRDAGGRRYVRNNTPTLQKGASLSVVFNRAMPLCRKIANLLRQAEPDFSQP